QQLQEVGKMQPALAMYDDAAQRFGKLGDAREQSVALMLGAIGHGLIGDATGAFDLYGKAQAAAKRAADPQMEARVLSKWGVRETFSERPAAGFDRLQISIQKSRDLGDWETELDGLINAGYAAYLLGRYETGLECDERALSLARAAKYISSEAWAQF